MSPASTNMEYFKCSVLLSLFVFLLITTGIILLSSPQSGGAVSQYPLEYLLFVSCWLANTCRKYSASSDFFSKRSNELTKWMKEPHPTTELPATSQQCVVTLQRASQLVESCNHGGCNVHLSLATEQGITPSTLWENSLRVAVNK